MTPTPLRSNILPLAHGFFTRLGGVSTGPYATLNCSLSSGDARASVLENRTRAVCALGATPTALVGVTQIHGATAVRVTDCWAPGTGPRADAMVTDRPGLALGIITGDCAPVLLADAEAGVIGAAHAGWRGAAAGVIEATIAGMAALGASPARIVAAIGPCIRQESYEVGTDLRDTVLAASPDATCHFAPGRRYGHWQFDLPGYCAARLAVAGVQRVDAVKADTAADEDRFFSHRRRTLAGGGPIGHQISILALIA
jgi:YfiH family protein